MHHSLILTVGRVMDNRNPDDDYDDTVDPEQVSKCYKDSDFMGFRCDDCDCKDFS
jgi:hypothetical protein